MNSIESIGENIRILRLKNGFSQEQLALCAGVNTSYIGQIERGEKNPTIKILEQISAALEITLVDLLTLYDLQTKKSTPKGTLPLPNPYSPGTYSTNSDSLH
ncbi:helix-turn-helix domain-containing protein [Paenibacillus sp. FSL R7-0302]|uniref:helix-turn-helix domain-containing protein n=1 Tax=Paenibacillus sp. FSL R7-0302 TaxID=2921681 RepID=UPI004046AF74